MTTNFTLRRLAWIGIFTAIILVLGLLLVPKIRQLTFQKAAESAKFGDQGEPLSGTSGPPSGQNPASSSSDSGIGFPEHVIIFYVLDALSGRGIEGASLQIRESKTQPGVPLDGEEFVTDKTGTVIVSLPAQTDYVLVRADGYGPAVFCSGPLKIFRPSILSGWKRTSPLEASYMIRTANPFGMSGSRRK